MIQYKNIIIERRENEMTIWLNRPKVRNALNEETFTELLHFFKKLKKMQNIQVLVLQAVGNDFSAGADIQWMKQSGSSNDLKNVKDSKLISDCINHLYQLPFPTIALVQGAAYGGAIGLLAACDIVVCKPGASFCFSEVRLGLAPAIIMPYVLKRVKTPSASYLIFSARKFDTYEAWNFGLVDVIADDDNSDVVFGNLIANILKASPAALIESKKLLRLCNGNIPRKIIKASIKTIAKLKSSAHGQEGLLAFIENRVPDWASTAKTFVKNSNATYS